MPDPAVLVVEVLFGLLFAWSLWTWIRTRDALARDVTLVFAPIAALFAIQAADSLVGPLPEGSGVVGTVLLLIQPVFSLKLVADLRPVPRALVVAAVAATAIVTGLFVLTAPDVPRPVTLAGVAVFVLTEAVAAGYLTLEARRRAGAARFRLAIAALATAALAATLLAAGAAVAVALPSELTAVALRGAALLAAIGYWIAFLPPNRLRELWQATAAFHHQQRILRASPSADPARLWADLAATSAGLTDAASVVLVRDGPFLRVAGADRADVAIGHEYTVADLDRAFDADAGPVVLDLRRRTGLDFASVVPMLRDDARVGAVVLLRARPSLFDGDDHELIGLLAVRSATLVQRREVLAAERELSERLRQTVVALEAASAAKSDFLASMSHELRTPLNAIIGFSELMAAEGEGDTLSVPREWVEHIRSGGSHLVALINDVLDLSKIEAGRLELTTAPVDVDHAVAESVAGLRPLADRKRQRIEVEGRAGVIEADPGRLRQILYNLLSNAIKYTGDEGRIRVVASHEDGHARIAVVDDGVGIAAEDHERVFEEFRQVGDASQRASGTGLGLALTRRLVEAHGGRIELESAPGRGSTFTVTLPAGVPARESAGVTSEVSTGERGAPVDEPPATVPTVLVIEDDPSSVRLLQAYLGESGYRVTVAPDGERGLRQAAADPPAAILLDVLLPGIDGWEVLRRLKSEPAVRDVPVVIVTVVDERQVGLALGAVDYFVKPVDRDALLARLARHTFTTKVRTRPIDVLAIDDDPATLQMIDATLTPLGFTVRRADGGEAGLALARSATPDLVICDLLMPRLDGFQVVAALRADEATAGVPILVLTAHELTAADKERLNGRILGVIDKGDVAAAGLREWLRRVVPAFEAAGAGSG